MLNNKCTRDTHCGCHQHQSGKHQGTTRKKEKLYIGESPKTCYSRLCWQQAVLQGPENQTLHLVLKVAAYQNGIEAATKGTHPRKPEGKQNKQQNPVEKKSGKRRKYTHWASFYCLQTGFVCPVKSESLLLDGRPPHGRRVILNQIKFSQYISSDFASASETSVIFSFIMSWMFRCSINTVCFYIWNKQF